ncbi:MAG: SdrD B-like domain-containing protein [Nocardioides sp.]
MLTKTWLATLATTALLAVPLSSATLPAASAATSLGGGVVNAYFDVNAVDSASVTLGASSAGVSHNLAAGDRVLLIQMTGTPDSGLGSYDLRTVAAASGADITFTQPLAGNYDVAEQVQLVWLPGAGDQVEVSSDIEALAWNGDLGGVVALAGASLTLSADINADGKGYTQAHAPSGAANGTGGKSTNPNFAAAGFAGSNGNVSGGNGGGGGVFGGGGGGAGANMSFYSAPGDSDRGGRGGSLTSGGAGGVWGGGSGGSAGWPGNGGNSPTGQVATICVGNSLLNCYQDGPGSGGAGGGSYGAGGGSCGSHYSSAYSGGGGGAGGWNGGGRAGETGTLSNVLYGPGYPGNEPEAGAIGVEGSSGPHYLRTDQPRLFMGGAGGNGPATVERIPGGAGGGIVLLEFRDGVSGDGQVTADGGDGASPSMPVSMDAGAGGGAGGNILVKATSVTGGLFTADGGDGAAPDHGSFHAAPQGASGGGGGIWFLGAGNGGTNTGPDRGASSDAVPSGAGVVLPGVSWSVQAGVNRVNPTSLVPVAVMQWQTAFAALADGTPLLIDDNGDLMLPAADQNSEGYWYDVSTGYLYLNGVLQRDANGPLDWGTDYFFYRDGQAVNPKNAIQGGRGCSAGTGAMGLARVSSIPMVSVGDFVWFDGENDGRQDGDLDVPLEGIELVLTGPDGKQVFDVWGNAVEPTLTDADGWYTFIDLPVLPAGDHYRVTVTKESVPSGMVPTLEGEGDTAGDSSTWTAESVDLVNDGDRDPTLDFGFWHEGPPPVLSQPEIRTMASTNTGSIGLKLRDKIWVSGLEPTDRVRVAWVLRGAARPVHGTCKNVKWQKAPIRAEGAFTITGDGIYNTRRVTLNRVGCYTYSVEIAATSTTLAASHLPGHPAETVRVQAKVSPTVSTGGSGWLTERR